MQSGLFWGVFLGEHRDFLMYTLHPRKLFIICMSRQVDFMKVVHEVAGQAFLIKMTYN